jgi:hypothetical protein
MSIIAPIRTKEFNQIAELSTLKLASKPHLKSTKDSEPRSAKSS